MSEIVFNPPSQQKPPEDVLRSQIENLQTTLASLNQQVITLQEALQERDQKIADLQTKLTEYNAMPFQARSDSSETRRASPCEANVKKADDTVAVVGLLINLYQFVFQPGKDNAASTFV